MDQTNTAQVQMALECVSKDLDRVQSSLSTYEQIMLKGERVTPQLKEVVVYYRDQVTGLRKVMIGLCEVLTSSCKREAVREEALKKSVEQAAETVAAQLKAAGAVLVSEPVVEESVTTQSAFEEAVPETSSEFVPEFDHVADAVPAP